MCLFQHQLIYNSSTFRRAHHGGIQRSAFQAMFGCDAKLGLSTTSLPKKVYSYIRSEEELQELMEHNNIVMEQKLAEEEQLDETVTIATRTTKVCISKNGGYTWLYPAKLSNIQNSGFTHNISTHYFHRNQLTTESDHQKLISNSNSRGMYHYPCCHMSNQ